MKKAPLSAGLSSGSGGNAPERRSLAVGRAAIGQGRVTPPTHAWILIDRHGGATEKKSPSNAAALEQQAHKGALTRLSAHCFNRLFASRPIFIMPQHK